MYGFCVIYINFILYGFYYKKTKYSIKLKKKLELADGQPSATNPGDCRRIQPSTFAFGDRRRTSPLVMMGIVNLPMNLSVSICFRWSPTDISIGNLVGQRRRANIRSVWYPSGNFSTFFVHQHIFADCRSLVIRRR